MSQYHPKSNHIIKTQESDSFPSLLPSRSSNSCINPEQARHFHKQKSELCKQYVQTGYCIYQKRCKFAHGSHELQSHREVNVKYKTKRCEHFWQNNYCIYGNRCNYIHQNPGPPSIKQPRCSDILIGSIWRGGKVSSRLLRMLYQGSAQ